MTGITFSPVRFGDGYDMDEVDAFLDRAERCLRTGDGSLTPEEVLAQRFTATRFAEGYAVAEVDNYLDNSLLPRLQAQREAGMAADVGHAESPGPAPASATGPAPIRPSATTDDRPSGNLLHPAEHRPSLLRRLFGGGR